MKFNLKRIESALRVTFHSDIVSVLRKEFRKISYYNDSAVVEVFLTASSLENENNPPALKQIIASIKRAAIARMIELLRLQETEIRKVYGYNNDDFGNTAGGKAAKSTFDRMAGPYEANLRRMRSKFYEVTRDGSFFETE